MPSRVTDIGGRLCLCAYQSELATRPGWRCDGNRLVWSAAWRGAFDTVLMFSIDSNDLQLADSGNIAPSGNTSTSAFQSSSRVGKPASFQFTVTGVKQ